jgi:hypothetical protein
MKPSTPLHKKERGKKKKNTRLAGPNIMGWCLCSWACETLALPSRTSRANVARVIGSAGLEHGARLAAFRCHASAFCATFPSYGNGKVTPGNISVQWKWSLAGGAKSTGLYVGWERILVNKIHTIQNIFKIFQIKRTHGMESFQCPVDVPNHKKRSYMKRC